jgi:hypothetical protein
MLQNSFGETIVLQLLLQQYRFLSKVLILLDQSIQYQKNDITVVFSHRGTKTFSTRALEIAKESGATTVLITGIGSPLMTNGKTDFRIETCTQENCGAFTISLTSAITRIIPWIGMYDPVFLEKVEDTTSVLEKELPFKVYLLSLKVGLGLLQGFDSKSYYVKYLRFILEYISAIGCSL